MKLIIESKNLEKEFLRLQKSYKKYYWLTAWAGPSSLAFKKLVKNENKIEKIIVGIHFYQTHPDFIETFLKNESIRYIMQPQGTYHPKLFLFYNSNNDWEAIIGSANFTQAAFKVNTEISTLISSDDKNSKKILFDIFKTLNLIWKKSELFDENKLINYKKAWKNNRPKINSLSGNYGNQNINQKSKPIYLVPVANMDWSQFMIKVRNDKFHNLTSRLKVLNITKSLFKKATSFKELNPDERKFIAGIPNKLVVDDDVYWGYFGSMQGNGIFKNKISVNDVNISNALDEIPLSGQITKVHYLSFLEFYKKVFIGNYLATATRLLAMKRPDIFVCLDSKNKSALCKDFGIVQSGLDYERYWSDIIERIYDSQWWLNSKPNGLIEKNVSENRAAFLDSIYYEE